MALAIQPGTMTAAPREDAAPDSAEQEYLKINSLFNRELFDLAIPRYKKLLKSHPDFKKKGRVQYAIALSHHSLADAAEATGDAKKEKSHREKCVSFLKKALKSKPFDARREAMETLADDLLQLGDFTTAEKVFKALHSKSKGENRARAALGLADSSYERGDFEKSTAYYRSAHDYLRKQTGKDSRLQADRAAFHLALSLYQQEDAAVNEALKIFNELSSRAGDYRADSQYMAALATQKSGQSAQAIAHFENLIRGDDPKLRESGLYGKGSVLFQQKKYADAAATFAELLDTYPRTEHRELARLYLGRSHLETGKLRTGASLLNKLRRSPKVGAEASLWLARAYSSRKLHSRSITIIEAAIKTYPRSSFIESLRLDLCVEFMTDDRQEEAREQLKRFLKLHPDSEARDHAIYLQAYCEHQSGKHEASNKICDAFLREFADSRYRKEVIQLSAENLFLAGKHEEAATIYENYLEEFEGKYSISEMILVQFRLAESRFYRGDYKDARSILVKLNQGPLKKAMEAEMKSSPVFESYFYLLGDISYQSRKYDRAVQEFDKYLERDEPRHADDARFKKAHSLQLAGRSEEAKVAYKGALAANATTPHALQIRFELGQISLEARDFASARSAFEDVEKKAPESELAPHALHFLGWIHAQEGRHEDAARSYSRLVDRFPQHELHAEALYLLALSLQASSKFDAAREVLQQLEKDHPEGGISQKIKLQEGVTLSRQGKHDEARPILESLVGETLPEDLKLLLHYELAWCYRGLNEKEKASASYREIIRQASGGAKDDDRLGDTARLELAELEFDRGHTNDARALLSPLSEGSSPLREKALYRLGWCNYREGNLDALKSTYEQLNSGFPRSEHRQEISLLLARLLLGEKKFKDAGAIFAAIAKSRPTSKETELAWVSYAECLNEERRFPDAEKELRSFIEKHPGSTYSDRAQFALGWARENQSDTKGAATLYRKVVGKGAEVSARAQFQLGQCLAAEKNYEDAIVEFLQVPTQYSYPEWSCRALLQIAGCFEALDENERARKYYTEVTQKYPERSEAELASQRLKNIP